MEKKFWYQKQLRILQTVLRESDQQGYDAEKVVAYMKKTHTNCIVVNAGGIVDFFPNETDLSRRNQFMGEADILKELVEECHKNNIRVMVRVDFRGVEKQRYEQRPDWFAQDKDGGPVLGWNFIYKPCYNSYYANEHAEEFIYKMLQKYDLDGVWENSVGFGSGPCYCKRCQSLYKQETGQDIPKGEDYHSHEYDKYRKWKADCADRHLRRMRNAVKYFGEEKAFCAEIFGMFHASNAWMTGIDLYNAKSRFDFLVSPAFLDGSASEKSKWDNLMYAGSSIRFLKSIDPEKEAVLLYGNNGTKWRYIKAPQIETKIWMWEAAAVGGGFWNCMFNGQCPDETVDRRNAYIEKEVYEYLEEHQKELEGKRPVADVGIYYSKPSRDFFGNDKEELDEYGVFIKGAERILTENHISWEFIPDLEFNHERIKNLKVLLLPNAACISEKHMDIIREYVSAGGGIVASYKTSLFDENGKGRADFGLADLFGCSWSGIERDTSADCYQKIQREHPLLENMEAENTELLMNEGRTLLCQEISDENERQKVCTYVPKIENQPPEFAWIKSMDTVYPTVMTSRYGKGKVVYFSNQADKLCYTNGHEDFLNLYKNAIDWVKKDNLRLYTNAPSSVHITWMECPGRPKEKIISFVNVTAGSGRPIQEIIPVHNITTKLYSAGNLKNYDIWKGGKEIEVKQTSDGLMIRIPKLTEFAAIWIETK